MCFNKLWFVCLRHRCDWIIEPVKYLVLVLGGWVFSGRRKANFHIVSIELGIVAADEYVSQNPEWTSFKKLII